MQKQLIGKVSNMNKVQKFFKEVVKEMRLVNWPNKFDIKEGTVVVIVMSTIVGIFLAIIDLVFSSLARLFI